MARGATKTAENNAQQISTAAQTGATTAQNTAAATTAPQIALDQSYLQPGGNPAVTAATMGALGSTMGAAKAQALDEATRTNNAASTNAAIDQLARTQGTEAAQAAANNITKQQQLAQNNLNKLSTTNAQLGPSYLNAATGGNNSYISGINSGNSFLKTLLGNVKGSYSSGPSGSTVGVSG